MTKPRSSANGECSCDSNHFVAASRFYPSACESLITPPPARACDYSGRLIQNVSIDWNTRSFQTTGPMPSQSISPKGKGPLKLATWKLSTRLAPTLSDSSRSKTGRTVSPAMNSRSTRKVSLAKLSRGYHHCACPEVAIHGFGRLTAVRCRTPAPPQLRVVLGRKKKTARTAL